jgi:sec-independent protein translocase protein TatA
MMIPGLPQVGGMELLILLIIILLLFGAKRIPSLARSLGSGLGEFRKGVSGHHEEEEEEDKEPLAGGGEGKAEKPDVVGQRR